jgi:protein-S-isoprenylcysteine O-methyltransferase Ste14
MGDWSRLSEGRERSIMKGRDHAGVLIPPPLLFVIPLIVAAMLHSRRPWPIADGNWLVLALGSFIIATGIAIGLASVYSFRQAKTTVLPAGRPTTAIVENGPYRFTRNPMYVAMSCAYIGLSLLLNSMWALLLLPFVVIAVDLFVIRREERYLTAKFGEPYGEYCARVRRWL